LYVIHLCIYNICILKLWSRPPWPYIFFYFKIIEILYEIHGNVYFFYFIIENFCRNSYCQEKLLSGLLLSGKFSVGTLTVRKIFCRDSYCQENFLSRLSLSGKISVETLHGKFCIYIYIHMYTTILIETSMEAYKYIYITNMYTNILIETSMEAY
jgi:hypothetical protein